MSQEWYYSVDGDRQGPIASADLKKLADAKTIKPDDLVWKDGMPDWVQAKTIKGLFGSSAGTAAPAKSDEPVRARARDDDERPSAKSRRRDEDDDEDERPRRRRNADDDDDERPSSKVRRRDPDEDEDEGDRPARRRDEDDEDDVRPRKKKRRVPEDTANKKMVAGLLGILLGGFGVHKFYLGFTGAGVIMLLLCCTGISGIIGLIEGIIYLTKSDEDFHREYVVNQKQWF